MGFDIDNEGAGSTQRVDLPNGEILLPSYYTKESVHMHHVQLASTVMRCGFDGKTLTFLERGTEHTVKGGRGMGEPSLAHFDDRYFLTLRNDDCGYVTRGSDGLHFDPIRTWTFDDGSDLGNYNTQQHWLTMPDGLFLVYTRRGANNDHVVRHRAPLFIAGRHGAVVCDSRHHAGACARTWSPAWKFWCHKDQ